MQVKVGEIIPNLEFVQSNIPPSYARYIDDDDDYFVDNDDNFYRDNG